MRIEYSRSGGFAYFPGLSKPITIDTSTLEPGEADRLTRLIEASHFFMLPDVVNPPPPGAADIDHYTLSVDDGQQQRTVNIYVPILNQALLELVEAVKSHADQARAGGGASSSPAL